VGDDHLIAITMVSADDYVAAMQYHDTNIIRQRALPNVRHAVNYDFVFHFDKLFRT
jgi:hypothetical protein